VSSEAKGAWRVQHADDYWVITYEAMASPCEILVRCSDASEAGRLASLAVHETTRIERKFSRYLEHNIVHAINQSNGRAVPVDEETARLLQYAAQCYELSGGLFDITSGVLRRAWTFAGTEVTPDRVLIASLRQRVGWHRAAFDGETIRLEPGMEIDLGGIGKEYAADKVAELLRAHTEAAVMVNLGGDIRAASGSRMHGPWTVGIESPHHQGGAVGQVQIADGGVATSGDARRFCIVNGERLGHILDPHTGWPVANAPRSVTVVAGTCTAAGFLSTVAMLQGPEAESFLEAHGLVHHCVRGAVRTRAPITQ
jgi:thiamine biosynthesis lipoprotein